MTDPGATKEMASAATMVTMIYNAAHAIKTPKFLQR